MNKDFIRAMVTHRYTYKDWDVDYLFDDSSLDDKDIEKWVKKNGDKVDRIIDEVRTIQNSIIDREFT